ncbi:MAG TPA: DUF4426 domain-containing protein [Tahibacter sp.]|uniref:DUF4426 domain-containing protein n=1 Tax=Tahibacter sp. TaxID=2056211 RepID=UPI002B89AEDF|nr:DUF4426 domain-containing protein [Tahibacter sp.]HSX60311.1 DUF4426 domain-containing protein [Tahibacter sp.]
MKLAYKIGLLAGAAILMLLLPARGRTEQMQRFDGHLVHYNALSTDLLPAQAAAQYKLTRSSKQGLLNIAVQKAGEPPVPVAAEIRGTVANLAGQRSDLAMREIRETDAIYYIAEFPVRGSDTLSFDLRITPAGGARPYTLKFSKNYVTE